MLYGSGGIPLAVASDVRPRRGLLCDEAQGRFARESPARARVPSTPARMDRG